MSFRGNRKQNAYFQRITRKTILDDLSYSKILEVMQRSVSDFGYCEKKQVMLDACVLSLPLNDVPWGILREMTEEALNIKLVPVTGHYFNKQAVRRRRVADEKNRLDGEDVRRCLAYHNMPSGFISSTSPKPIDRSIVEEALRSQYSAAGGMKRSTDAAVQRLLDTNLIGADKAAQLAQRFSGSRLR